MSSSPAIEIVDVASLKENESAYVKPFRVIYKRDGKSKPLVWDCVKSHDSVSIIIYNVTRNVLVFVRQFRPPVFMSIISQGSEKLDFAQMKEKAKSVNAQYGYTLELCAGVIDKKGLTPAEIAREEVVEETGYNPPLESLESVTSFRTGVGHTGSLQYVFYCQVDDSMRLNKGGGIDDESIEVIEIPVEDCKKYLYPSADVMTNPTTPGFRVALGWFLYEKYATLNK